MSDNGKDNWRQLTYDSVNSTNSTATFAGYHFDVIYDDSLNPVIYTQYGGSQLGRSFDSGSTWILLDHDEIGFDGLPDEAGRPFYSKQRRLSKSVGAEGTMYSSTDARNWTKLAVADSSPGNTVAISMLTLFDSDLDIVIHNGGDGLTGETYWSDNFGETWTPAKIEADSGSFTLEIVDLTKTETGAYYAIANSDSYGRGGYTSVDLKEWYLVDKITGGIVPDIQAVEHVGDGNYVRAGQNFTDDISTSSFSSSSVEIGTLNFDGKRVMLKPDMDSEHAWNIAEHSNLFDSVQALIDSDHAWANETFYDSVAIKTLIDSGYVQARVTPGTIMAGGRFIVDGSFTHDSSDVIPSSFVKSLWGIRNIVREDAGQYKVNFDSANNVALQDSYSYIVQTTIDYNDDNPTASTRNVAVLNQDSDHFVVLMERADDGVNQDYTSGDKDDRGARITFSVIKAI